MYFVISNNKTMSLYAKIGLILLVLYPLLFPLNEYFIHRIHSLCITCSINYYYYYNHIMDKFNEKRSKNIKSTKKVRKHQGIYQIGPKKGQLKSGYKYSGKTTKTGLKIIIKDNSYKNKHKSKNKPILIKYNKKNHLVKHYKQKGGALELCEKWKQLYTNSKQFFDELKRIAVVEQNKENFKLCMEKLYDHYKDMNTLVTVRSGWVGNIYPICQLVAKHMNTSDGVSTNISNKVLITRPGAFALVLKADERTYIFREFENDVVPFIEWYNSLLGYNINPPISANAFSMCFFKYDKCSVSQVLWREKKKVVTNMVCYSYETLQDVKDWLGNTTDTNYSEKEKKWMSAKSILINRFGVRQTNMQTPTHNILIKNDDNGNITALYCDMGSVLITGRQTTLLDTDHINSFTDLKKYLVREDPEYWRFASRLLPIIVHCFQFDDVGFLMERYYKGDTIAFSEKPNFETKKTQLLEDVNDLCKEFNISFNKNFSDEFCSTLKCNQKQQIFFDIHGARLLYSMPQHWNTLVFQVYQKEINKNYSILRKYYN